jgi:hypothetical protein
MSLVERHLIAATERLCNAEERTGEAATAPIAEAEVAPGNATGAEEAVDAAVHRLREALGELASVVQANSMLAESIQVMSATDCAELAKRVRCLIS